MSVKRVFEDQSLLSANFNYLGVDWRQMSQEHQISALVALACLTKSKYARFGAVLVSPDGHVIGRGRNRKLDDGQIRDFFPAWRPFRSLHAEQSAVLEAKQRLGRIPAGSILYVLPVHAYQSCYGVRPEGRVMFSCPMCARMMQCEHLNIMLLSEKGWIQVEGQEAVEQAAKVKGWKNLAPDMVYKPF